MNVESNYKNYKNHKQDIVENPNLDINGHKNCVFSVAFSSDGERIVSGSWDNTIKIWDSMANREFHLLAIKHTHGLLFFISMTVHGGMPAAEDCASIW